MTLKLVVNNNSDYKFHGKRYARDIRKENKELKDIDELKRLLYKRYEELLYTEILLTKREESSSKKTKIDKTYGEFIRSLKKIREKRENNEK